MPSSSNRITEIALGAAVIFLAVAALIPATISHETNVWFWTCAGLGVGFVAIALLPSSRTVFRWIARLIFGVGDEEVVLEIRVAEDSEVDHVYELARREFGEEVTSAAKAREIRSKYRDAITVAICKDRYGAEVMRGYYMTFPINKSLVDKIERYRLKVNEIAASEVATKPQYGYAFYIGGIVGQGWRVRAELLGAMKRDHKKAAMTKTRTAYAKAATEVGRKRLLKYGFEPVHAGRCGIGDFFKKTFAS